MLEDMSRLPEGLQEVTDKRCETLKALMPHFDTEEEALRYAERLAALKPGDRVKVPCDGSLTEGIFTGIQDKDGDVKCIIYRPEERRLFMNCISLVQIVVPDAE